MRSSHHAQVPAPSWAPTLADGSSLRRFVILGLVGRGAMGEVYAAYDPNLDRKIAINRQYASGSATACQNWFVGPTGDGYFRICSDRTFHCLSVGSNTSGAVVQGRPSTTSGANMEWNILVAQ